MYDFPVLLGPTKMVSGFRFTEPSAMGPKFFTEMVNMPFLRTSVRVGVVRIISVKVAGRQGEEGQARRGDEERPRECRGLCAFLRCNGSV